MATGLSLASVVATSVPVAAEAAGPSPWQAPSSVIFDLTVVASARAGQELETTEAEIGNDGDPVSSAVSTKRRKVLKWLKHAEAENLSDFIPVFATLARAAGISERIQRKNPQTPGVYQRSKTLMEPDLQGRIVTVKFACLLAYVLLNYTQ